MDDVRPLADDVCRRIAAAFGGTRWCLPVEPADLELASQAAPRVEIHDHLGLPARGVRRRPVHVEVAIVTSELHEGLEVAAFPPGTVPARPHAKLPIVEEVLRAGGEAEVRLGALVEEEVAADDPERLLVHLGAEPALARVPVVEHVGGAGRRGVAELGVLRRDDGRHHLAVRLAGRAFDARDRRLRPAHPRRADEAHAREDEARDDVVATLVRRGDEREAQVLDEAQRRRAELDGVRAAQRNAVERPSRLPPLRVERLQPAIRNLVPLVGEIHHVPEDALVGPARVEEQVAVQVLGIEVAVAVGAPRAQVAPGEDLHGAGELARAERRLEDALPGDQEGVGPVAENADVVLGGVEDAVLRALGVEPAHAHVLPALEEAVRSRHLECFRGERQHVLAHGAEVDHHLQARGVRRLRSRLEHPELEVFRAREVDAGGAERGDHRAPAGAEGAARQRPLRPVVVADETARRVRVKGDEERRLELVAAAGDHDRRVDILGAQLERLAVRGGDQVLPRQLDGVRRIEGGPDAEERIEAVGALRHAAELPGDCPERDRCAEIRLELLEVRRAGPVRVRARQRELRIDVELRRRDRGRRREPVEKPGHPAGPEAERGVDARDQVRLRLESELRPVVRRGFALEDADEVDRADGAERIRRREAENRGRRHGEDILLLEACRHLRGTGAEERVRAREGDEARAVIDRVVGASLEDPPVHRELLAVLLDLECVEAQRGPVGAADCIVAQPHLEAPWRALREEQVERCPVERVRPLRRREAGGIGERLQVREHDVRFAHHRVGARVAEPRKDAILAVEDPGIGRDGEPELREVRRRAGGGAFRAIE